MAANPISEPQIEAHLRLSGCSISPAEFDALCLIDDAVLGIANRTDVAPERSVSARDGAGVKGLMRGLGAKKGKLG